MVLCGVSYARQLEINEWTHQNGVHFIAAEARGLFGYVLLSLGVNSFLTTLLALSSMISALNLLAWTQLVNSP